MESMCAAIVAGADPRRLMPGARRTRTSRAAAGPARIARVGAVRTGASAQSGGSPAEPPAWLRFLPLGFPSANVVVTTAGRRVLFDSGYGSDADRLFEALAGAGAPAGSLDLVVNTHWHSDHVGGNARLQSALGVPVAAGERDAGAVNARDPGACLAEWLDQPVEPYRVDRVLRPGDPLEAGPAEWEILATPGHTPGHLSFHQPDERLLVVGDALHADDVGWLNVALDGPAAIDDALRSVEALSRLPVRLAMSGHGPAITDPPAALAAAHARYERMRADPQRAAWHACKRILAFALMIHDGIPVGEIDGYLTGRPWLADHARAVLGTTSEALAADLLAEMRRAGAVDEQGGRLVCRTPSHRPPAGWRLGPGYPRDWPATAEVA
jgi:glyoxylase-like metal-dependent hydrolase (beta-lactamase superfamily II)